MYTYKFIYLKIDSLSYNGYIYMYIFKISPHRWSSMVVGSKGWAERRYIREVKDVQRSSDTSRILKDIQEAFSRSNTEGRTKCLQSQRRRFYASSACRGAITVPTVATSEGLRFGCLPRCNSSASSRHVGGSALRVPAHVEGLFRCLQSQRRRFYASSACRGAIPRRLSSQRRRFNAPSWPCHIRPDFKDTATSRRPPPPLRQNQNEDQTSPQRQERTVS